VTYRGGSAALSAALAPLSDTGRADAVVRRIDEAVTLGLLSDGDQLPPENELAVQLGVANGTVREALAVLREQGIVETRRGRGGGSFVRASDGGIAALHLDRLRRMSTAELRDIGDEKLAVTGTAARLAAERAPVDIASQLKKQLAGLRSATTPAACRRAEARFHLEVAVASQSVRLSHAEFRLQAELGPLVWLPDTAPSREVVADRLEAVLVAIVSADAAAARTAAEEHVLAAIRTVVGAHLRLAAD
jgi:GntR family transcriptional regulator, transcriptional repressor for pyruvate dehydrogenase complex